MAGGRPAACFFEKDNTMQHDHWNEANEADRRYREYAARVGYGNDGAGRAVFGAMALGDGPRQHQALMSEMNRLSSAGAIAGIQAQVADNEMAMRQRNAQQAAMDARAHRDEVRGDARYDREMRLRESDSFAKNNANQTMANSLSGVMGSAAVAPVAGTGGVSMTVRGAGGQRIGGGSVSPLRSLVG
jgi:hypothetical protein